MPDGGQPTELGQNGDARAHTVEQRDTLVSLPQEARMLRRDNRIPDLVTVTEAADMLGVSRAAINKMVHKSQLTGAQIGGRWVFRRNAVQRLLADDETETDTGQEAL